MSHDDFNGVEKAGFFLLCAVLLLVSLAASCAAPTPQPTRSRIVQPAPPPPPLPPAKQESPKEDRLQHTNMGLILTAVVKRQDVANSQGSYLSFTFQEDSGFMKEFYPVCDGQMLLTGRPVAIMYHWHPWESVPSDINRNSLGCYMIDGYQTK